MIYISVVSDEVTIYSKFMANSFDLFYSCLLYTSLEAEEWTPGPARLTGVIVDGVFYAEEVLSILPEPEIDFRWNHYAGQLHNHSALSGGWGSPGEIYAKSAREEHMDFFAVTDHSDSFVGGGPAPSMPTAAASVPAGLRESGLQSQRQPPTSPPYSALR